MTGREVSFLAATIWKDKQDVCKLAYVHKSPATSVMNMGELIKYIILKDYSQHMAYIYKGDRVANRIWGSHGSDYEDACLLGCSAV
jgi:hypothetical protein